MHVRRAIARTRKPVVAADVALLRRTVQPRERHDLLDLEPGDGGRPLRRARRKVLLEFGRDIGVLGEVGPIRHAFLEQHMHHRTGQRAVGTGLQGQVHVGLRSRAGAIRVHDHELRAALFSGDGMRHHVDLGVDRVAAPDHHEVRMLVDLAHVGAALEAGAGNPARVRQRHADRGKPARVLHLVAQAVDAVALHMPHRAGIEVRPDRFRAVEGRLLLELLRHGVERLVPRYPHEGLRALGAGALHRELQAVRVMDPLGIARDLLADHAIGVGVAHRAAHAADRARILDLDLQRTGAGAIVRADRGGQRERGIHRPHRITVNTGRGSRPARGHSACCSGRDCGSPAAGRTAGASCCAPRAQCERGLPRNRDRRYP